MSEYKKYQYDTMIKSIMPITPPFLPPAMERRVKRERKKVEKWLNAIGGINEELMGPLND